MFFEQWCYCWWSCTAINILFYIYSWPLHNNGIKLYACVINHSSPVQLCVTLSTVACQAPMSMGFSRQEYWSGLPCPPPGDLPNPGIKPVSLQFSSVQWLSHVQLFATPWTAARQASLSITNSWSLPKITSTESLMSSNHLILCRPLLLLPPTLPASGSFPMSQLFSSGGQSTGVSASTSVLPMNTQDWSPLGWTGWISL